MKRYLLIVIYFFILPPGSFGQQRSSQKFSAALAARLLTTNKKEYIDVIVVVKDSSFPAKEPGISILKKYHQSFLLRLTAESLESFRKDNKLLFADIYRKPKEELTTGDMDLSLNKITTVHSLYPTLNGNNIFTSIKEQRFDTTDIDIKGRTFITGAEAATYSSHASIMATIIGGAGNSSVYATGVAPAVFLSSADFSTLLPDADAVIALHHISVQNHSYGTAIENYYGPDAEAYDLSAWNNPQLLYVFSAGNSGNGTPLDGTYSGIPGFANITGSFKMAKNIITVGATDSFNNVMTLSSRGPAFDGRVKPDLVAFGEDGSSGAAALVSGTAVLMQQAYKNTHNKLPSSALIKAILINSAGAVGNRHVNYATGYGSLNALNALQTINENRFSEDEIIPGVNKVIPVTVPLNTRQLKITLSWTDTPTHLQKVLFNDLDVKLTTSNGLQVWYPWVLNKAPNIDSLSEPEKRGIDTINNTEQITVDRPVAGDYLINISGDKIKSISPQSFSVAWQLDTVNSFRWTFPSSPDVLTAGKNNVIRWQSDIDRADSLEFSFNGLQWQKIAGNIDLSPGYYLWNTPDTVSQLLLRISFGNRKVVSDTFVLTKDLMLKVGFNCADSFLLYWNNIVSDNYVLYRLGPEYLEKVLAVKDSFIVLQKAQNQSLLYSVAPVINGKSGRRSFAIDYTTQGTGCYFRSFYALLQPGNKALLALELGTLYQVQSITFQRFNGNAFIDMKTISGLSDVAYNLTDNALTQGVNLYRVQLRLKNGTLLNSEIQSLYNFPNRPVLLFPNPASQNKPVQIIVKDQGVYTIKLYDAMGRLVNIIDLVDINTLIPPFTLPKGLYYVQVTSAGKQAFVEKLVVE